MLLDEFVATLGLLHFEKLRHCVDCGQTEIVIPGQDVGPVVHHGDVRCNGDWHFLTVIKRQAPR
jgi:hypothetical protein